MSRLGQGRYRAVLSVRVTALAQGIWASVLLFLGGEQEAAQGLYHICTPSCVPMPGWDIMWEKCKWFPNVEKCTEKH